MTIVSSKEIEGKPVLTIDSGFSPRSFAQSRLPRALEGRGIIIHPSLEIDEWIPEGTHCDEHGPKPTMLVFGPYFPGKTLLEIIEGGSGRDESWNQLHLCISLLTRAFNGGTISKELLTSISGAGPEAILVSEDGRILILPPELYTRCIAGHDEKTLQENRLFWIHPDYRTLNPSWSFAFMSGTLAYRIAAGFPPFKAEILLKSEQLALNMRKGIFEPLQLALWPVRSAAAACINALISSDIASSTDTLLAFGPAYAGILDPAKEGISESPDFLKNKKNDERKRNASVSREKFIRKYKGVFTAGAVVLAVIGILGGTYIHDMGSKPTTAGMETQDIVTGFYQAVASLDQEIPRAYTANGVKADYTDMTTNLYVTSKVRAAYEHESGMLTPAGLFALGEPGKKTVFGITGLAIEKVSETDTQAEYSVSFYLWMPLAPENAQNPDTLVQLSVYAYQDTVRLEKKKERWKITKIVSVRRSLVEGDGKKLFAAIADGSALILPYAPAPEEIERAIELAPKQ